MKLNRLPVFEIIGNRNELNGPFLERLAAELVRLNLFCTVVSAEDIHSPVDAGTLARKYDVVFVEGESGLYLQKISLLPAAAERLKNGLNCIDGDESSFTSFLKIFLLRLQELTSQTPVRGCILIGGKSSRMGRPKHLIKNDRGRSWLDSTVDILRPLVDEIVISGAGDVPDSLSDLVRLTDIAGVGGPMSGFLSASRCYPLTSWLLIACDMPNISRPAIEWLLSRRSPGRWGIVPRMPETGYLEPLFAWYDMRAGQIFESQLQAGVMRIGRGAEHQKIENPTIPWSLRDSWKNINTPEQLQWVKQPG
ncbi:MAG: molybdenum cofactor guanylyltransferase [Deltaproteobacteria bacterium]|nr:molybdenum cofactor guanylyltransferase [Deltaproteobacteria bacterium]